MPFFVADNFHLSGRGVGGKHPLAPPRCVFPAPCPGISVCRVGAFTQPPLQSRALGLALGCSGGLDVAPT